MFRLLIFLTNCSCVLLSCTAAPPRSMSEGVDLTGLKEQSLEKASRLSWNYPVFLSVTYFSHLANFLFSSNILSALFFCPESRDAACGSLGRRSSWSLAGSTSVWPHQQAEGSWSAQASLFYWGTLPKVLNIGFITWMDWQSLYHACLLGCCVVFGYS